MLHLNRRVEKIVTFGVNLIAMLNPRENMVVIDGQIKTANILHISTNSRMNGYDIVFNKTTRKTFSYGRNRAMWLTKPVIFDPQHCHIYHNGRLLWSLAYIAAFQRGYSKYWYVEYPNGAYANYLGEEISFVKSWLEDQQSKSVFVYLRRVAAINPLKS